jgi:hypothetical protein
MFQVSSFYTDTSTVKGQTFLEFLCFDIEPTFGPETSATNSEPTPHNIPEEQRPPLYRGKPEISQIWMNYC